MFVVPFVRCYLRGDVRMPGTCCSCNRSQWWKLRWSVCPHCQKGPLCGTCIDNPIIEGGTSTGVQQESSTGTTDPPRVTSVCRACMEKASTLDFSSSVDVIGPETGPAIVFVHGGGGCRLMFRPQARKLASRGYRCVLLDLPAHGALLDEPLSIDSACERIVAVTHEFAPPHAGVAPAYVGGSLGGYIGMELLGRNPDLFSCAVIASASQTVGVGAGIAARVALWVMKAALGVMSGSVVVNQMLGVVRKRPELDHALLVETFLGPGMFFQHGVQHVRVLQQSNPLLALQNYRGPILFADGSLDHHDNRARLLELARSNNSRSNEAVYEVSCLEFECSNNAACIAVWQSEFS